LKAYHIHRDKLGDEHLETMDTLGCLWTVFKQNAQGDLLFEDWMKENIG
jgi:hypothetical protein